ncbi:MAG: TonB-dependent receptor [Bacteroidota bacterium]
MNLKRLLLFLLAPFLFIQAVHAQSIKGTVVTNPDGAPLVSARVIIKGTSTGVIADEQGKFSLQAQPTDILQVSYIGYETIEVTVGNQTNITITMIPSDRSLDEVVVVGYGTQGRAKVTGAISSVDGETLAELPVVSVDQALQGRAAGVYVANTGSPGRGATVRIRGVGTVGNNNPLYVIDGVPAGGLNEINPNDIESVEILKDASAAAIYGSRAANGVVLVTTKKGKVGKPVVSFDSYVGVQNVWRTLDLLESDDYITYATEIQENAGLPAPSRFTDPEFGSYRTETDWQDELFRSALIQEYNLAVSGGAPKARYRVSGGYLNQEGTMLGTDYERYTFRVNTDFDVHDRVRIGQTLTLAYGTRNNERNGGTNRSMLEHAIKSAPYQPIFDSRNLGGFKGPDQADNNDAENPIRIQSLGIARDEVLKLLGTAYAEVDILDGLTFKTLVGMDMAYTTNINFNPAYRDGEFHDRPVAEINEARRSFISPLFTNSLNYTKSFGSHNLDVLGVIEFQSFDNSFVQGIGENALSNDIRALTAVSADNVSGGLTEWSLISYIGRLNYDYAGKYILSATVRRDGSSRFGPANKWGVFPSFSVGWNIAREGFMNNVNDISSLKVRGSWGQTGNQSIGEYGFLATVNQNFNYNFNGSLQGAATISALANENLQWETTTITNIGLDFGLFNDALQGSIEYYINETEDILVNIPLPISLGFDGSPRVNAGVAETSGMDFALNYNQLAGDFQWSVGANMGLIINNEVTSLGQGQPINGPTFESDAVTRTEVGQPIFSFWGWKTDGIFQTQEEIDNHASQSNAAPGDIRFVDVAGPADENGNPTGPDGVIDANDRTFLGSPIPDFTYGINGNIYYKNFDLTLFLQGVQGNLIYNTTRYDLEGMTRVFNAGTEVLDRWTGPGTSNEIPRGVSGDPNRNTRMSDRFLEDGSFLRMKLLSVGYTINTDALSWLSRARVYVSAQNLFTITDYTGYDPEIGARQGINSTSGLGIDFGQYPQPRTFLAGVQLSF